MKMDVNRINAKTKKRMKKARPSTTVGSVQGATTTLLRFACLLGTFGFAGSSRKRFAVKSTRSLNIQACVLQKSGQLAPSRTMS